MSDKENPSYNRFCDIVASTLELDRDQVSLDLARGETPGWDSMGHLTLMMEVERAFGVRFSTKQIEQTKNLAELWGLMKQLQS